MTRDPKLVQPVFLRAVELPAAERAAFLGRECAGDGDLRQRVEALLRAHDEPGSFLPHPAAVFGPDQFPPTRLADAAALPPTDTPIGTQIGPYRLIQRLGEGGMGTVYVAEQAQPVKRRVALKVIKAGLDSQPVVARFAAERQALALMDHPNIARILDAGATAAGQPYFVMELAPGVPLTRYCDELHLSVRERLGLFVPVCRAIQHAHQKGVIHRDVKPSNVLVVIQDGKPTPKVIDFGVAKAASQRLTDATLDTEIGQVVGTLEYMSPEQAELSPLGVDTRADVYALGVLLYELLTGQTPLGRKRLRGADLVDMLRLIREEEPAKPSTRLTESPETLADVAARRRTEPGRLAKEVRGDLDWIVMKALEKDRTRRYESADGLARDVQRHLDDEPVEACPPSAAYRLRKLLRRHKGPVLAAAAMLVLLVGGIIGTSWGLVRANQARGAEERRAEAESAARAQAEEAQADMGAFAHFLSKYILAATRPEGVGEGLGINVTLAEALTRAEPHLEAVFAGRPKAEALARHEIGETWRTLGKYAKAEQHFRRALELSRAHNGADHDLTLSTMTSLGVTLSDSGRFNHALQLQEAIVAARKARLGEGHFAVLCDQSRLAAVYIQTGQFGRAARLQEATLKALRAEVGDKHPETLDSEGSLALAYGRTDRLDEAVRLLQNNLQVREAEQGDDHPDTLTARNNLATAHLESGKSDLAIPLFERTLRACTAKLGDDHPETLGYRINLAMAHLQNGNPDLAVTQLERVLTACEAKLDDDHPVALITRYNLVVAYHAARKFDRALALGQRALAVCESKLDEDHPLALATRHNLAMVYRVTGKPDLAVTLLERTVKARRAVLGDDNPQTLESMHNLGVLYRLTKQVGRSIPLLEETLKRRKAGQGATNPNTLLTLANLGLSYREAGRLAEAVPLLEEAHREGGRHPSLPWVGDALLQAYGESGKTAEATALAVERVAVARERHPADSPQLAGALAVCALALLQAKAFAPAEPILRECLRIRQQKQPDDWGMFNTQSMLGGALLGQKKYAEAEPLLVQGYEGLKKRGPPASAKVRLTEALERLVQLYDAWGKPQEAAKWRRELEAGKAP